MAPHFYRYDGDQDLDVYGDDFRVTAVKTGDVVELSEPTLADRPDFTEVDGTGKEVTDPAPAPPFLLDPPDTATEDPASTDPGTSTDPSTSAPTDPAPDSGQPQDPATDPSQPASQPTSDPAPTDTTTAPDASQTPPPSDPQQPEN